MTKFLLTFPDDTQEVIDAKTGDDFLRQLQDVVMKKGMPVLIQDLGEIQ